MNAVADKTPAEGKYTLVLPYPVSANRYWRPVKLGERMAMVPTKEAKAYKAEVQHRAMLARCTRPLLGRIELHIDLYPARPQDWAKRERKDPDNWDDSVLCMDLGNCEKVLSDALNGLAWVDDKQIRRMVKTRHAPDEFGARVVVSFRAMPLRLRPLGHTMELEL